MTTYKRPHLMCKHPFAAAYAMGFYQIDMADIESISENRDAAYRIFKSLNEAIKNYHADWVIDEVYYRGVDFAESYIDNSALVNFNGMKEPDVRRLLGDVVKQIKHHPRLLVLTHAIGKKLLEPKGLT